MLAETTRRAMSICCAWRALAARPGMSSNDNLVIYMVTSDFYTDRSSFLRNPLLSTGQNDMTTGKECV